MILHAILNVEIHPNTSYSLTPILSEPSPVFHTFFMDDCFQVAALESATQARKSPRPPRPPQNNCHPFCSGGPSPAPAHNRYNCS